MISMPFAPGSQRGRTARERSALWASAWEAPFALYLAAGHGFSVSAVNYGAVPKDIDAIVQGACPIVGSFGAKDRTLRGAAARLEQALARQGIDHDVREYPDAGHSFFNNHDSFMFSVVGPLIGAFYHEATEADARQRILKFFARHLA
jgi:carboxymethylenebutenolidase